MQIGTSRILCALLSGCALVAMLSEPVAAQRNMTKADVDKLVVELSNWGRWGEDDQLGTLNTITAQKRIDAAGLVSEGESVSLALPLNTVSDQVNQKPFVHESFIFGGAELEEMGLNPEEAAQAVKAGADIIVTGTLVETSNELKEEMSSLIKSIHLGSIQ